MPSSRSGRIYWPVSVWITRPPGYAWLVQVNDGRERRGECKTLQGAKSAITQVRWRMDRHEF